MIDSKSDEILPERKYETYKTKAVATPSEENIEDKACKVSPDTENNTHFTCNVPSTEISRQNLQTGKQTTDQIIAEIKDFNNKMNNMSGNNWFSSLSYEDQENNLIAEKQLHFHPYCINDIIFNTINSQFDSNMNVPINTKVINEDSVNVEELDNPHIDVDGNYAQNFSTNSVIDSIDENQKEAKVNKLQHEIDTDSIVLSAGQSTDLERYLDSSAETLKTDSTQNTPSSFKLTLADDCSSQSNLCLSCTDSSETLVALSVSSDKCVENKFVNKSYSTIEEKNLNSSLDSSLSSMDENTENTVRQHIRKSSYTLDEPSPALLLALGEHEVSHFASTNSQNNSVIFNSVSDLSNKHSENLNIIASEDELSKILTNISLNSVKNLSTRNNSDLNELISHHKETFPFSNNDSSFIVNNKEDKTPLLNEIGAMKKTMEDLLHVQEINFENARQKLAKMQQEQMELLLKEQRQQWQFLIEELNLENKQNEKSNVTSPELVEKIEGNNTVNNISPLSDKDDVGKVQTFSEINNSNDKREFSPEMLAKFNRVSAVAKGYLTRRLMKTERVQNIIQTIKDTLICALKFHQETPIKKGKITVKDAELHKRLIAQLTAACYELHDIFFKLTPKERMAIISQSRYSSKEKIEKEKSFCNVSNMESKKQLSSATLKVLERKKRNSNDNFDGRKSSKYHTKAIRRGNAVSNRPSVTPPTHKYAHQTSLKQEPQKVSRKSTVVGNHSSARKKLLESANTKK
ncbi:uncharacterized protein [Centruroides vittatus]|uniref:uncharacterized protein n=1 Tax=Centruroides vittatus TaxID=120091 RepID=UPI00351055E0